MKNLYILVTILSCLGGYAQLENSNWYFGERAGLSFNNSTVTELIDMPILSVFYKDSIGILEGCATISNKNGSLLFYTNGQEVFSSNHQVMENGTGLLGNPSSSQNAIIIPKPGISAPPAYGLTSSMFYVVTIDGESGLSKGLYYSIIDMGANNGLGKVMMKNTPLNDHLGVPINSMYNYGAHPKAEKLTYTYSSDGESYWIITQIKNFVYSYSVTTTGITLVDYYTLPTENPTISSSKIKVSPDSSKIATTYNKTSSGIGIICGSFNNTTGDISAMTTNIPIATINESLGTFEFSPNSSYLYFIVNNHIIYKYNFSTSTKALVANTSPGDTNKNAMQLAMNGIIYIGTGGQGLLSTINNPNNFSSPGFLLENVSLTRNFSAGFPQINYWHDTFCDALYLTSEPGTSYLYDHKYAITTLTNYTVHSGSNITMKAQGFVQMNENTYIEPGAVFYAGYGSCVETRINLAGTEDDENSEDIQTTEAKSKSLIIYPNPSDNIVNFDLSNGLMSHITIMSYDGKIVSDKDIDKSKTYNFDTRQYSKGIYFISVQATDGKVYLEKLVVQ